MDGVMEQRGGKSDKFEEDLKKILEPKNENWTLKKVKKLLYKITLVELTGQRSNEFEADLNSFIKHFDVID